MQGGGTSYNVTNARNVRMAAETITSTMTASGPIGDDYILVHHVAGISGEYTRKIKFSNLLTWLRNNGLIHIKEPIEALIKGFSTDKVPQN